jgi:hypothetical protein
MFSSTTLTLMVLWLIATVALPLMPLMDNHVTFNLSFHYANFLPMVAALVTALLCWRAMNVFRRSDGLRKVWFLLGLGVFSWGVGAAIAAGYPFWHNDAEVPYPWYSDFGYLGMMPLIIAALLIFKRSIHVPSPLWGIITAVLVWITATALALWSSLGNFNEANLPIEFAIEIAYIVLDPLLLAVTVFSASMLAGGAVALPWWFGFAGLLLYYLGNVAYDFLIAADAYSNIHWINMSWPVAFGLIALAAMITRTMFNALDD